MAKAKQKENEMTTEHEVPHSHATHDPLHARALVVQGVTLRVPAPYQGGHVMTQGEADAMNQLFAENLRNSFSKRIKTALDANDGKLLSPEALADFQVQMDTYASKYSFDNTSRQRAPRVVDPVERKLLKMAEQAVVVMLNSKGYQKSQISKENFQSLVETVVKTHPGLREDAARAVELESHIAQNVIASIGGDYPQAKTAELADVADHN